MAGRCSSLVLSAWVLLGAGAAVLAADEELDRRLENVASQIERLRGELGGLERRERGVLGEIERLAGETRLREAELTETVLRLEKVGGDVARRDRSLAALAREQERRRAYLVLRLRQLYREGQGGVLRRLVGDDSLDDYLASLRYAGWLSERDAETLEGLRRDGERIESERAALAQERDALQRTRLGLIEAEAALERSRGRYQARLDRVRDDVALRRRAMGELQGAADELTRLTRTLGGGTAPALDVRKFRGLLDWPAVGRVGRGFGDVVHPRFKTKVPHPGLDIEATAGSDFVTVFDGQVVYAAWLHGYGLTVIVDHGQGILSIYAHAMVLLVEEGEAVVRGQTLGKVGDTGSLSGPQLYFELREGRQAVDPRRWLRSR